MIPLLAYLHQSSMPKASRLAYSLQELAKSPRKHPTMAALPSPLLQATPLEAQLRFRWTLSFTLATLRRLLRILGALLATFLASTRPLEPPFKTPTLRGPRKFQHRHRRPPSPTETTRLRLRRFDRRSLVDHFEGPQKKKATVRDASLRKSRCFGAPPPASRTPNLSTSPWRISAATP